MRLTLRNLLAYMDDLLDPESARIIGQKTEESEFASGLLNRIRDVTRRTKLGAPGVIDRKAALDPNTVAEYLDNILPPDRVTDFEKACLDSDVELAEVAACHQILTLVLGEPAEVRPESRVRMYHLPETAASQTYVERDEADTEGENRRIDTPTSPARQRRHPAVPEYLLAARRHRRRLYGFATVAAVLCVVTYLGATGRLSGLLGSGERPSPPDDQVVVNMPAEPQSPEVLDNLQKPSAPVVVPTPESSSAIPAVPESPAVPEPVAVAADGVPAVDVAPASSGDAKMIPAATPEPLPATDSVVPVTPTPSPVKNAGSEIPVPGTPLEAPGSTPDPGQMASLVPAVSPDDREPIVIEAMVPEVVQGREIGRLIKPEELALMADGEGESFHRISNSKPLRVGQRVVSLPMSRPIFLFDGRLNVEMVDGGEIELLSSDENEPPHIKLAFGRMLLTPSDEAGVVKVLLDVGSVTGTLSLAGSTTLVALEVGQADGPTQDPVAHPVGLTAHLWGVSGEFSWQETGGEESSFESPMMVDLVAGAGSAPVPAKAPAWIQPDMQGTFEQRLGQRVSGQLKKAFDFEKPADLILRENAYHRTREMRRLARQSLSWIEDFEPIVEVLNDPEPYVEWPEVIDLLRASIHRGPRTAEAVRASLDVKYGNRGDELYALLWKYDSPELSKEAAHQLVQYLSDTSLACRVLSFNNLNRITGKGFYYRAEENEAKRQQPVLRWTRWADNVPAAPAPKPEGTSTKSSSN